MKNYLLIFTILSLTLIGCSEKASTSIFDHVISNNSTAVGTWLDQGGNPDTLDQTGESLLYLATGPKGGHEVLQLLIERGANINKGSQTYSPLMNAASWVNAKAVKSLLEAGADISIKNSDGKTALEVIGDCGACPEKAEIISLLQPAKAPDDADQIFEGEFVYMADANMFFPCDGSKRMPVDMSGAYLTLEQKYTSLAKGTGKRIYCKIKAQIKEVPAMEGKGNEQALIVSELLDINMSKKCN